MATEVVMPKLGLTMERGTIGSWLKGVGDPVERGEPLLEVVTDKVTMEVEAQASGVLRMILVAEGEEVDVATPIGVIAGPEEDLSAFEAAPEAVASGPDPDPEPPPPSDTGSPGPPAAPAAPAAPAVPATPAAPAAPAVPAPAARDGGRPHRASPKARRLAAERGIDLTAIAGSGPGGRVVSADVEAHRSDPEVAVPGAAAEAERVELTPAQRVGAERLTASYQQAPHIFLEIQVSALWLQRLRSGYQAEGQRISYNDLILKAVAAALVEHPRLNSHFVDGCLEQHRSVDIGIATDTGSGLLVPVLRGAQSLGIGEIAAEARRLTDSARQGKIGVDDLQGGTFTVSNLGMFGLSRFTAIINPPQVAILAVGAIEPRVVAVEGEAMAVRPAMNLTLSADHRAVDGAAAARFLARLRELLESPGPS